MTFTSREIHTAILKAAIRIEQRPDLYDFFAPDVGSIDAPHCMLGWIGHFLGMPVGTDFIQIRKVLGLGILFQRDMGFYEVTHGGVIYPEPCARALRHYAKRFAPLTSVDLPAMVRAIFELSADDEPSRV